ncbi:putative bifunctional diguanylate cyclase/phosphodiesterase [Streptomyces sp. NBC_00370]|uniref:putative bifunctional diguanylate cyclase/phosphodiesterase n=1 Tax=Streptomyces sp. NBC_00370 TaxID=2975728 RepID=UPI002E274160
MSATSEGPRSAAVAAPGDTQPSVGDTPPSVTERHPVGRTATARATAGGSAAARTPSELRDYRAAFQAAQLAMAVLDHDGAVVSANEALGELLGTEPAALREQPAADLVDLASDARTWHAYHEVLGGRRARFRCTRRLKHAEGRALWAEVTVAPVPESESVLLSIADISDRRELQARLRHLQMHDPVTRLPNRALFFERLSSTLGASPYENDETAGEFGDFGEGGADGRTGRIGLCYLDLDGFKAVNDTLGHRVGDRLLAAVAGRLTECADHDSRTRSGNHLVARLGGDEFGILVEDSTGTEQLTALARSVLAALQLPFDLAGQRLSVSASIGVVERTAAGTTPTALMQAADTTLYWAKADGKARWTLFDPERNAHRMTRQALSSTLRPAVEREEFVLEYQPLVGMADGTVRGVEALVRWNHPQFGTLAPNRFIGIAEEDGSIVQLGGWVLRTACRQARQWQQEHPDDEPLFVSVNVAVRQVWDSDLVSDVAEILAETGLSPALLQLELTESAVMGSAGRPLQALQALSEMGVRIAIDDFGTGYSNLAYLSRLPVSVLKLDGSFVRGFRYDEGAHPSPADEMIVEALVQLAHRLGLTVTAECVETAGQAERLRGIGCDTGQGWLYSRAVSPDRITRLLTDRTRDTARTPVITPQRV